MTVATEALDDFVSVTLLQVKPKSGQLTVENLLKADVKRLLQSALPEMVPKQVLEASIERLSQADCLKQNGKASELTPTGRERALQFLEVSAVPARLKWDQLLGYLLAKALGVAEVVTKEQRDRLRKAEGLRHELVRQHLKLELPVVPGSKDLKNAVGWTLLASGGNEETIRRARTQKPSFAVGTILDVLCLHAAGITTYKRDVGFTALAAHAVKADGLQFDKIVTAVLLRLLAEPTSKPVLSASQRTGRAEVSQPSDVSEVALNAFAERVREAARRTATGRFGDRLVFVSHVWRSLQSQGHELSLEQFKAKLAAAHRARAIVLSKADMPQVLDSSDLNDSRIQDRDSELVFIEV